MPEEVAASVEAYLKANGMWDAILAASGVSKGQPDAGDVHKPTADGKDKKPKPTVNGSGKKPDEATEGAEESDIAKRFAAADPVFAKGDAGTYAYRPLTDASAKRLHEWATAAGVKNIVPPDLMHVTQVHSKTAVKGLQPISTLIDVKPQFLSPLGDKGAMVLFVGSQDMQQRFAEAKKMGAEWDFPNYRPHVTLSYDAGDAAEWSMLEPPDFPIQLGPEQIRESNATWVEDNGLRKSFETHVSVSKVDDGLRKIWGWASVCAINGKEVIDKQGDIIPIAEIEKAAHEFLLYSREQGDMHSKRNVGKVVESWVFTPEREALGWIAKNEKGETVHGWAVAFLVTDDAVWKSIKSGDRPELSIGGHATPTDVA